MIWYNKKGCNVKGYNIKGYDIAYHDSDTIYSMIIGDNDGAGDNDNKNNVIMP